MAPSSPPSPPSPTNTTNPTPPQQPLPPPPPENANEGCVGPSAPTAGTASSCAGCPNQKACSSGTAAAAAKSDGELIRQSLKNVSHTILVLSGKGGVGKSTVASQLAFTLSHRGYNVGLLDVDICGPSIPTMTGVSGHEVHKSGNGWSPVYATPTLAVMSVGFILPEKDAAVIWRGPRKNGMIRQFLTETDWGGGGSGGGGGGEEDEGLDYLIVDTPPGTSDEHISTVQFLQNMEGGVSGALVVTTPEEISMADVRKELNFCKKTKVPVIGVVENMSSFRIPVSSLTFFKNRGDENVTNEVLDKLGRHCPEILDMMAVADVFSSSFGGPSAMADKFQVPYLGALPLDPNLLKCCEEGMCFVEFFEGSPAAKPLNKICDSVLKALPIEEVEVMEVE